MPALTYGELRQRIKGLDKAIAASKPTIDVDGLPVIVVVLDGDEDFQLCGGAIVRDTSCGPRVLLTAETIEGR
jgi:hypothetical protein